MAFPLDFPANPTVDDIHPGINGVNYQWDGSKWTTRTTSRNSSLGGNPGVNPPLGAVAGDFWFDTSTGQLYIAVPDGSGVNLDWTKTSIPYSENLVTLP